MTDLETFIVHLNPDFRPVLSSLATDCVSPKPADQIYFCIARLRILMRGVVVMLESDSTDVRKAAQGLIDNLSDFTLTAEIAESFLEDDEEE
ncbi:MAG: hypothetical protein ABG776_17880 [Cyanobacteria bacterium J06555_13]